MQATLTNGWRRNILAMQFERELRQLKYYY